MYLERLHTLSDLQNFGTDVQFVNIVFWMSVIKFTVCGPDEVEDPNSEF